MSGVFISYRRDDSQGYAGRMAHDLERILGPNRVFSDVEIPVGADFTEVLHQAVAASDALLVVIGRHWAGERAAGQPSRLFEEADWVRIEIESALTQGKQVIPVLVGESPMPPSAALPAGIRQLTKVQAARLDDRHWDVDLERLVSRLRELLPSLAAGPPPTAATPNAALTELARRAIDVLAERSQPAPRAPRPGIGRQLLRGAARALKAPLTLLMLLGLVYVGVQLFGDARTIAQLDALQARLLTAWDRLPALLRRAFD